MSIKRRFSIEEIANIYNAEVLGWRLERAEEIIDHLVKFKKEIQEQVNTINKTKFIPVVVFRRKQNRYHNRVEYYICVEHRPQLDMDNVNYDALSFPYTDFKTFKSGAERKAAQEYAAELSEKYSAEIERVGV